MCVCQRSGLGKANSQANTRNREVGSNLCFDFSEACVTERRDEAGEEGRGHSRKVCKAIPAAVWSREQWQVLMHFS